MATIITLGSATKDLFLLRPDYDAMKRYIANHEICIVEGTKNEVHSMHYALGGGALNTAVAFNRLGHYAVPLCMMGNDDAGRFIMQELKRYNIETKGIKLSAQHRTGISCIIACESCDSASFVYRGANNYLAEVLKEDIQHAETFYNKAYWYCAPLVGDAVTILASFLAAIRPYSSMIAINPSAFQVGPGYSEFISMLRYVDIVISNTREARILASHFTEIMSPSYLLHDDYGKASVPRLLHSFLPHNTILNYALYLMSHGPRVIVVTDGSQGVYVINNNHIYFHPSLSLNVVNTVGGGDAFGATLFSYLINGETCASALARAMINSAAVLHTQDGTSGLLSAKDVQRRFEREGTSKIQEFTYEILH